MLRPLVLTLLFALGVSAQDPWAPVHQRVVDARSPDAFTLVASDSELGYAWFGEHGLGAASNQELRLMPTGKGPAGNALTQIMKGPGWALYDPGGNRLAEGAGLPTPEQVQSLMESTGWKLLREGLKAHLRLHPEDGQAWLELAHGLARQAAFAKMANSLSKPLFELLRDELQPCLKKLAELPDAAETWQEPRPQPFATLMLYLRYTELDIDSKLKDSAAGLKATLPNLIARDPEAKAPWQALTFSNSLEEEGFNIAATRELITSLEGIPGQPWPPLFLADYLLSFYIYPAHRLEEASQIASTAIATSQSPAVAGKLGRPHVIQALAAWGLVQFQSLLYQHNRVDDAVALISSLRSQAGSGWPTVAAQLGKHLDFTVQFDKENKKEGDSPRLTPSQLETLRRGLREPPVADPPALEPTTLRLALLEGTSDLVPWGKLQIHPVFTPWGPMELSWQPLKKAEASRLRERHGWPQGKRWLLMKQDQVLVSGPGFPSAATLESALRSQGIPELEALNTFIKAHPERLDARRARLELVQPRLPHAHLESLYLEDLEATGTPLKPLPFKPDPRIWAPVARRLGHQTSQQLRRWPFNLAAWRKYSSWSALDPQLPNPAALLSSLDTWPRQSTVRLPGPIPAGVSRAVMATLRDQERYEEMDAWMQALWDGGLETWMTQWAALPALGRRQQGGPLDRVAPEVGKMISAWGEALSKQGKKPRLAALGQRLEALRPGLSALLSGPQD